MKSHVIRNATARVLASAAFGWGSLATAQTVVVQPGAQPAPPPPPPAVATPGATPPSTPLVLVNAAPPPVAPRESAGRFITRPNRSSLWTGLIAFGQPYIASIGIAATSVHPGDSNLWIPAIGPWLDLGARRDCQNYAECDTETGIRVLLIADGLLQTFGAFEIIGAFAWPETVSVPTVTTASGASLSLAPGHFGRDGYGVAGVGRF